MRNRCLGALALMVKALVCKTEESGSIPERTSTTAPFSSGRRAGSQPASRGSTPRGVMQPWWFIGGGLRRFKPRVRVTSLRPLHARIRFARVVGIHARFPSRGKR